MKGAFKRLGNRFRSSARITLASIRKPGGSIHKNVVTSDQSCDSHKRSFKDETSQTEQPTEQLSYVTESEGPCSSIQPSQPMVTTAEVNLQDCDSPNIDSEGYAADAEVAAHYTRDVPFKRSQRGSVTKRSSGDSGFCSVRGSHRRRSKRRVGEPKESPHVRRSKRLEEATTPAKSDANSVCIPKQPIADKSSSHTDVRTASDFAERVKNWEKKIKPPLHEAGPREPSHGQYSEIVPTSKRVPGKIGNIYQPNDQRRYSQASKSMDGTPNRLIGACNCNGFSQPIGGKKNDTTQQEGATFSVSELVRNFEKMPKLTDGGGISEMKEPESSLAIPLNLHRDLSMFLGDAKVQYYSIRHNPDNIHRITVSGSDVTKLQVRLNSFLRRNYSKFSIITQDKDLACPQGNLPNFALWIDLHQPLRCCLATRHNADGQIRPLCIIELILKGYDMRRERKSFYDIFGITTAHSFMTPDQCMDLSYSGEEFLEIVREIEDDMWHWKQPFLQLSSHLPIDVAGKPLPVLRYWFQESRYDDYSLLSDAAMFKLDKIQLRERRLLSRERPLSCQYGRVAADDPTREPTGEISKIVDIRNAEDIIRLIGRRIICAGKYGRINPNVPVRQNGWMLGLRLCVVFDDDQVLERGDCGSIVYLLGDHTDPMDYMIGIFFGTLVEDPRIHQAVILSHALRQMEEVEEFYVKGVVPLSATLRPPSTRTYESGYYTTSRTSSCVSLASQKGSRV